MKLLILLLALICAIVIGDDELPYVILKTEESDNTSTKNFIEGLPQFVTLYERDDLKH